MQELQETRVWSLGQEEPLEQEMAAHSSILAWTISWAEDPGRPLSMESQRVGYDWAHSRALAMLVHNIVLVSGAQQSGSVHFNFLSESNREQQKEWK